MKRTDETLQRCSPSCKWCIIAEIRVKQEKGEKIMEITDKRIDAGKAFDWGRASKEYAQYRDIYPAVFYEKIAERGLCVQGQRILDLGTGTGVLPRNMYSYGAKWVGTDISPQQIEQAKAMATQQQQDIDYYCMSAEDISFPTQSFDVITACQCFWYFDYEKVLPKLMRILKEDGKLLFLYMAWLPYEDKIAGESERLVLKYSSTWSGAGEYMHPITLPAAVYEEFETVAHEEYTLDIPFTRETWNGRMKACRGVGASLSAEEVEAWEAEHRLLLEQIAPAAFKVKHYAALLEMKRKKK